MSALHSAKKVATQVRLAPFLRRRSLQNASCHLGVATQHRAKYTEDPTGKAEGKSLNDVVSPCRITVSDAALPASAMQSLQELSGGIKLNVDAIKRTLHAFVSRQSVRMVASKEYKLSPSQLEEAFLSFRRHCIELLKVNRISPELYITIAEIDNDTRHLDDLLPYFLAHTKRVYPHLECMSDLEKISDLTQPHNWFPEARAMKRRFIFHAGPTNSGKTYKAMRRLTEAESGVYCAPLKLLASEIYYKMVSAGLTCDLITGDERVYAADMDHPAAHTSCTIEMLSTTRHSKVAVIDEIQMIRDAQRGFAWTKALLGVVADEVHLCGEASCIDLVKELLRVVGEEVEVRKYERITPLTYQNKAVQTLDNVKEGDCIVCFNKADIFAVSQRLEASGKQVAVIYGSLPPGTKLAQAAKFNDPDDSSKVMVATDAVGMGINLSIKRVVFYKITKPTLAPGGRRRHDLISTSQALQIAGRAGRYGTSFEHGEVTTFDQADLPVLKEILAKPIEPVERAGLGITAEMLEMFSFHLPKYSITQLIDIFEAVCTVDSDRFFMCTTEDVRQLAKLIRHVSMPIRSAYTFCLAPVPTKATFVATVFQRFARRYADGIALDMEWLMDVIKYPLSAPKNIAELSHMENVYDALDLYLWLGFRFPDMFPAMDVARQIRFELDELIEDAIYRLVRTLDPAAISTKSAAELTEKLRRHKQRSARPPSPAQAAPSAGTAAGPILTSVSSRELVALEKRLLDDGKISRKELLELKRSIQACVEKSFLQAPPVPVSKRVTRRK